MKETPYIAFLLSEATRTDEEGFAHSVARRAGNRLKSAMLATAGGNVFGFGAEAKGQLYTQNIAAKLRRAWFDYAGKLKGRPDAKPTEKNIKGWMKKVYGVDVRVPSDGDAPEDAEEAAAQDEEEREAAALGDDGELDVAAADDPAPAEPEQPAPAEPEAEAKPEPQPTPEPQSSPQDDEIDAMVDYMLAGMGVKGFKPTEKLLSAQGRTPKEHLSYLRRFLQAAAGPETIDPVTKTKPFPNTTVLGKAIAQTTAALEKGPEEKVLKAVEALKGWRDQLPEAKSAVEQYLTGVVEDKIYASRYPGLAKAVRGEGSPDTDVPFSTRFRKVGGMLAVLKSGTKGSKPTAEQANQLLSGLTELIAAAIKGTDADRKQLASLMEPLETDSALINKVPQLRGVLARYKSVEESHSRYAGMVLREAGAEATSPNAPLKRVAFDKLFNDIAQQLIAGGYVSHDGEEAPRGGSADSTPTVSSPDRKTPAKKKPTPSSASKPADPEEEEFAVHASEAQQHIDEVAAKLNISIPRGSLNRLIKAASKKNAREIITTVTAINDKRVVAIAVAAMELFNELGYDANDFRKSVKHFAMLYRQPLKNTFDRYNPIVAAMANGNRRNLVDAVEDLPKDELRTFCGAMMMEVVNEE